jgi:hypothetical protein
MESVGFGSVGVAAKVLLALELLVFEG